MKEFLDIFIVKEKFNPMVRSVRKVSFFKYMNSNIFCCVNGKNFFFVQTLILNLYNSIKIPKPNLIKHFKQVALNRTRNTTND